MEFNLTHIDYGYMVMTNRREDRLVIWTHFEGHRKTSNAFYSIDFFRRKFKDLSTYQSFRIMALAGENALVRDSRGLEWASGRICFSLNHL